jgi:hypothetical protein
MQTMDCCSSCTATSADSLFPMGAYVPYKPGYGHTFSLGAYASPSRPTGITPVGVAGPCAGEPVARPCGAYERGGGNPNPEYPIKGLRTVGGYDSGVQSMGVFPLIGWGVIAGLGALGILGTTYVANTAVDNITQPNENDYTTPFTTTLGDTTKSFVNLALIGLVGAFIFRKEIKKAIK